MKTTMIGTKVSVTAAALLAVFFFASAPATAAEDLNAVYQQGRAAFYQGDFAKANQLLSRVAAANPRHVETNNMLAYIRANHRPQEVTLQKQYEALILPKVEFGDVTLREALEGLRALAKNASNGKVVPNVIIRSEEAADKKVSLTLSNIPLSEAINYLTQLTNTKATYDKHAVTISGLADPGGATAEASAKSSK
ncbi:MAG: tetratricopeptide repeat protein [Prosthecobacter sp.]